MHRFSQLLRRAAAASGRGRLGPAWRAAYGAGARLAAARIARRAPGATVYARGGVAGGDVAPGVSDIDLVAVVDGDPGAPAAARLRVSERLRAGRLVHVSVYEQAELDVAQRGPAPTFDGGSLFHNTPIDDPLWLRARPGVDGPAAEWRRLRGPERRRVPVARDSQDERIAAWLELQWWWRHAVEACVSGPALFHRRLGAKLVAEAAGIVLRLECGERPGSRRAVLERALVAIPEEHAAVRAALSDLQRAGTADLAGPIAAFARLCERVARHLELAVPAGEEVSLVGEVNPVPLVDWRAVVVAEPPEEQLVLVPGDPAEPAAIVRAAAHRDGPSALRAGRLLLFASADIWPATVFRTLQCPLTDPVSFALLDGQRVARFPTARGWSARDWAARAASEHVPRLARPPEDPAAAIVVALTAARAAGLAEGELALTLDVAAERLGSDEAAAWWRAGRTAAPPDGLARALLGAVRALSTYTARL